MKSALNTEVKQDYGSDSRWGILSQLRNSGHYIFQLAQSSKSPNFALTEYILYSSAKNGSFP
jgi:hypothetical protein